MVDLSHVSVQTMHDAISHSLAPVVFSHSSAYAIWNHKRNVPDSVLERLSETDGIVMINFYKGFVSGDKDCDVNDVARHVLHVAKVAGWQYFPSRTLIARLMTGTLELGQISMELMLSVKG